MVECGATVTIAYGMTNPQSSKACADAARAAAAYIYTGSIVAYTANSKMYGPVLNVHHLEDENDDERNGATFARPEHMFAANT